MVGGERYWSKLQQRIYLLVDKNINFQLHCALYNMHSQYGTTRLPRYWITIDKDIVWDYPKDFVGTKAICEWYPHISDMSEISDLLREYIDTSVDVLLEKKFEKDLWGLTDLLKVCDRRIGKRRLKELQFVFTKPILLKIIELRLNKEKK